jgi:channel protein (hemolysin III family)
MDMAIVPIPGFSEPFSCWSHLLAAVASLVGTFFLLKRGRGNFWRQSSLLVFSCSLIFLFSMSGVYHLLEPGGSPRMVLQRLDHAAIWILVAGTFTPIHVILFRGFWRWGILLVIWSIAITGLVLKTIFFKEIPDWLSLTFYLGLGWIGMMTGWRFVQSFGKENYHYLIWGGVAYSVGAILEFVKWPILVSGVVGPHEIFHVFVVIGATLHWFFIYRWASHPLIKNLLVRVRCTEKGDCVAEAIGESIRVEAKSIDEMRVLLREKIVDRFHSRQPPKSTRLSFSYEECWNFDEIAQNASKPSRQVEEKEKDL